VGAALVTIAVSYTHFLGMDPRTGTVGASGGIFGLLMAFGILYADQEMFLFPLPFSIKAKYLVGIWVIVAIVAVFEPSGGIAVFAHLGGLLFGFLWVKFLPSRVSATRRPNVISECGTVITAGSGGARLEIRSLHEGSRPQSHLRRARKLRAPDDNDKTNGGSKSGWVN